MKSGSKHPKTAGSLSVSPRSPGKTAGTPAPGGPRGKKAAAQQKKGVRPWVLIPLALGAVVLGLMVWLVIFLSQRVAPKPEPITGLNFESYLSRYWDWYEFKSWDEDTGTLELTAPINSVSDITLAQAREYALLEDVAFDKLALSDVEELNKMLYGQNGEGAIGQACGCEVKVIRLSRMSCDGEIVYTVDQTGLLWHCWPES